MQAECNFLAASTLVDEGPSQGSHLFKKGRSTSVYSLTKAPSGDDRVLLCEAVKRNTECSVIKKTVLTFGNIPSTAPVAQAFAQGRYAGSHVFAG